MNPRVAPGFFVVVTAAVWGVYWMPLRAIEAAAATGPWATFAAVLLACLMLAPLAWRQRHSLRTESPLGYASALLGGTSFVLYSNGLLYGRVAVVILLFYLTPIWSTVIGRYLVGWPITRGRMLAIALGFVGILLVMGPAHGGIPRPGGIGDWMGLVSGLFWAVASIGIRVRTRAPAAATNFVFCLGATLAALPLALWLTDGTPPSVPPGALPAAFAWVLLLGGFWWALSLTAFLWGTQRMEPARVGILMMSEVLVGTVSAAWFSDEPFGSLMAVGATLVVLAAAIESWPRHSVNDMDRFQ